MSRIRDYAQVVERLRALPRDQWRIKRVGGAWGYPWFSCERHEHRNAPTVLLSGGIHGEEPAGVEGVLRWLESGQAQRWPANWLVFPCINPYGWERNRRTNAQRRDINRQFRNLNDTPEVRLIRRVLRGRRFLFSIEFHEDVEASGYYLYELRRQPPFIGEHILRAVARVVHINSDAVIDGRRATGRGLIRRDAEMSALRKRRRWPMAFHLFLHCTDHVLGSETPVNVPLSQRAKAHVVALRTALECLVERVRFSLV